MVSGGESKRDFVEQVRRNAGLSDFEEADVLVRATLRTLAEGITGGQVDDLTSTLPVELRDEVSRHTGQARRLEKTAFLDRVSGELITTDLEVAEQQVRAVFSTLRGWSSDDEIGDTIAQLPKSIAELFDR